MIHYTTQAQAAAEARSIGPAPPGLVLLWSHVRAVLADSRANSDHLLIMADALRTDAFGFADGDAHTHLIRLAHLLADLAPARATPLTPKAP